jgi:hypothetical protein
VTASVIDQSVMPRRTKLYLATAVCTASLLCVAGMDVRMGSSAHPHIAPTATFPLRHLAYVSALVDPLPLNLVVPEDRIPRTRPTSSGVAPHTMPSTRFTYAPKYWTPASILAGELCIHSYEGSWNIVDPPFYGGMQFVLTTWWGVGGTGLPSNASPSEQLYRASLLWGDRYHQWPNSSRICRARGLA